MFCEKIPKDFVAFQQNIPGTGMVKTGNLTKKNFIIGDFAIILLIFHGQL